MPTLLKPPITAAAASAAIFILLGMLGFNSLFLIVSVVPLLYLGRIQPFAPLLMAAAMTSFILLLLNPVSSLFYITFMAVPVFFIMAHYQRGAAFSDAITDICAYMIVALAMVQLSMYGTGGIQGWIGEQFDLKTLEGIEPALAGQVHWLLQEGSYLMIGMMVWWSVLFLLAASWITDMLAKHLPNPPHHAPIVYFTRDQPPIWLFGAMLTAIGAGFLATENLRFLGLLSFVIILLPYFFLGAMYTPLQKVLGKSVGWSLVLSIVMMVLAWPAIFMAAFGVFKHTQMLLRSNEHTD